MDSIVFYFGILWYPIMENQMEKKMENEMETVVIWGLYWGYSIEKVPPPPLHDATRPRKITELVPMLNYFIPQAHPQPQAPYA